MERPILRRSDSARSTMKNRSQWGLSGLVLSAAVSCCMAKGMIVAEYPVEVRGERDAGDAGGGSGTERKDDAGGVGERVIAYPRFEESGYWSAYVRLESQDIPRLWATTALDYLLSQ
ncbi:hypothetical protein BE21_56020 [Sorangium cellulosum]|uniref:Uncharacterized protein n=1 Tax=Sorangium cellulosum TaxID=56 RepID=A0A150TAX0_SORCE|nr:hypothetical protein BE21_56020 [Sorangium cellulosum]